MGVILNKKTSNCLTIKGLCFYSVRVKGLEPSHLAAPDPKSGVSTNFTIPAKIDFSYYEAANIKIILKFYCDL